MFDEFLTGIESARTRQSVWETCARFFSAYGFSKTIYVHNAAAGPTMFSSLPQSWLDHYWEQNYLSIDPFFEHCCGTLEPIGTGIDYLEDHEYLNASERRLIMEASEAGIRSGFSCTTQKRGPSGVGGWNLGSELPRSETEKIRREHGRMLHLAALYGHEKMFSLGRENSQQASLSPRERDCLCWSARGLRTKEIADKLSLAPVSVELYLKNARNKLGAATREQAVAIAILDRLIEI